MGDGSYCSPVMRDGIKHSNTKLKNDSSGTDPSLVQHRCNSCPTLMRPQMLFLWEGSRPMQFSKRTFDVGIVWTRYLCSKLPPHEAVGKETCTANGTSCNCPPSLPQLRPQTKTYGTSSTTPAVGIRSKM